MSQTAGRKHKLDRYDAGRLKAALDIIQTVSDSNYTCDSDPLYRKLETVRGKLERILQNDTEPEVAEDYNRLGKIVGIEAFRAGRWKATLWQR